MLLWTDANNMKNKRLEDWPEPCRFSKAESSLLRCALTNRRRSSRACTKYSYLALRVRVWGCGPHAMLRNDMHDGQTCNWHAVFPNVYAVLVHTHIHIAA